MIVHDDFLSAHEWTGAREFASRSAFFHPQSQDPISIWHTNADHNPTVSKSMIYVLSDADRMVVRSFGLDADILPFERTIDQIVEKVAGLVASSGVFGRAGEAWPGLICSLQRFEEHEGLPWHRDSRFYVGAFSLYLHEAWPENAGGELLFSDNGEPDDLRFLPAKPNRLVLIPAETRHSVALVRSHAPNRLSLSGFFVRSERVSELLGRVAALGGTLQ